MPPVTSPRTTRPIEPVVNSVPARSPVFTFSVRSPPPTMTSPRLTRPSPPLALMVSVPPAVPVRWLIARFSRPPAPAVSVPAPPFSANVMTVPSASVCVSLLRLAAGVAERAERRGLRPAATAACSGHVEPPQAGRRVGVGRAVARADDEPAVGLAGAERAEHEVADAQLCAGLETSAASVSLPPVPKPSINAPDMSSAATAVARRAAGVGRADHEDLAGLLHDHRVGVVVAAEVDRRARRRSRKLRRVRRRPSAGRRRSPRPAVRLARSSLPSACDATPVERSGSRRRRRRPARRRGQPVAGERRVGLAVRQRADDGDLAAAGADGDDLAVALHEQRSGHVVGPAEVEAGCPALPKLGSGAPPGGKRARTKLPPSAAPITIDPSAAAASAYAASASVPKSVVTEPPLPKPSRGARPRRSGDEHVAAARAGGDDPAVDQRQGVERVVVARRRDDGAAVAERGVERAVGV